MPYIDKYRRSLIEYDNIDKPMNAGELNFVFSDIIDYYISCDKNYQRINDVIGALECCKLEVYRRLVAPYEDEKIKINGEVFSV